ncbi:acyltransferase [Pantoea stewartii subsp. indologenes]|uniref:acyltransferase family protein n=1 Tax=Pantoea stewartii TaxID=66269 RepID=UPI0019822BB2|nr:acyltransferase [Pantoea stewartii]MDK2632837.1 acyltransferase [Pantoea stewartii subsp. indologenes]
MKIVSIQYLRGLAALLVVLAHNSSLLEGHWTRHIPGALGVDVFFIISGFIMTFITHQFNEAPTSFMVKRFFRIWPVFFVVWLLSFAVVYHDRSLHDMSCALYFCLQDYSSAGPTFGFSALGPPWTLSYEILFYAVFTVAMCINYRYRSYLCALIFIVSSVGFQLYYNGSFDFSSQVSPHLTVTHWWQAWIKLISNTICMEFILGMLLAELLVKRKLPELDNRMRRLLQAGLVLAVITALITGPQPFGLHGGFWLAAAIMTMTVMLSYRADTGHNRTLIFLGDISYSLYLIHYPLMVLLMNSLADKAWTDNLMIFVLSVSASVALASVMFFYIEKPAIKAGKRVARWLSAPLTLHRSS